MRRLSPLPSSITNKLAADATRGNYQSFRVCGDRRGVRATGEMIETRGSSEIPPVSSLEDNDFHHSRFSLGHFGRKGFRTKEEPPSTRTPLNRKRRSFKTQSPKVRKHCVQKTGLIGIIERERGWRLANLSCLANLPPVTNLSNAIANANTSESPNETCSMVSTHGKHFAGFQHQRRQSATNSLFRYRRPGRKTFMVFFVPKPDRSMSSVNMRFTKSLHKGFSSISLKLWTETPSYLQSQYFRSKSPLRVLTTKLLFDALQRLQGQLSFRVNKESQMIESAEGSAGLLHKITKPTAWRGGAQILKKEEEDAKLLDRCEAKRKNGQNTGSVTNARRTWRTNLGKMRTCKNWRKHCQGQKSANWKSVENV